MANSTTQFGGFLTNVGIAQQANTAALGLPWNITHMLIGDAGGEPSQTPDPTPKATQDALVRQVYRAQLNALYPSPADPNVLVAELVLPPEIGGWWIRELALEDASGNFIAVAKPAPSYKPLLAQGSGRTQTIRMHVVFGNQANVTLKIDPSVVLATRDYADKAREAAELYTRNQLKAHVEAPDPHPQYLRRADVAKDAGQLAWLGTATGTANALVLKLKSTESTLAAYAAGQRFQFQASASNTGAVTARINTLAAVAVKKAGTAGLVDLVAGDIRAGALYDLNYDGTYFQLGGGVSAGKAFERFSFEASVGQTTFNLAHTIGSTIVLRNGREVTDYQSDGQKIIFRTACALGDSVEILAFSAFQTANSYTKAEVQELVKTALALPVGTMLPFPRGTVPPGFLEVDGSAQSASVYPDLAAYLGGAFDKGDEGAGFFRLPDTRGEFLRGWDHGRGVDAGRVLGSAQTAEMPSHTHYNNIRTSVVGNQESVVTAYGPGSGIATTRVVQTSSSTYADAGNYPVSFEGGGENRPRNLAVMWCIKAWNAPVNQGNIDVAALAAQVAVSVPKRYRSGLTLAMNVLEPTATIDVLPGLARASGTPVELGDRMAGVLQAGGVWTAGAGGNKLDTGIRAASRWYHVFIIRNASDGKADLLFSLSLTAMRVPVGFEIVQRLGSVKTDASGNVVPFINLGREVRFLTPIKDVLSSSTASSAGSVGSATLTLSAPPGVRVNVKAHVAISGIAGFAYMRPTDAAVATMATVVGTLTAWQVGIGANTSDVDYLSFPFECLTDTASAVVLQWIMASSGGTAYYAVSTLGYAEID